MVQLGGFVYPNDGQCYMDEKTGSYIGWNKFDYPSLSQIRKMMIDNQIVPIFASSKNVELYKVKTVKISAALAKALVAVKL